MLHACAQVGSALPALPPSYEAVVRRYAGGDRDAAIAEVAAWPDSRLRDAVRTASSLAATAALCPSGDCMAARQWSRFPVAAALMLHTDASLRLRTDGASPRLHESAAAEFAKLAFSDRTLHEFVRDWYAAIALRSQSDARWSEALEWAERGLEVVPDAPDLLLVVASVEEARASQEGAPPAVEIFDAGSRKLRAATALGRERKARLERARQAARAAVAAAPNRDDAAVRLGRIAWKLGEMTEAGASLEAVVARNAGGPAVYLAHLFLGRVQEDEGRLDDAARSYEAAASLEKEAQTARVALSHVRLSMGDAAAARREAAAAITRGGLGRPSDPFWSYAWGASDEAEARLESLRRKVSS